MCRIEQLGATYRRQSCCVWLQLSWTGKHNPRTLSCGSVPLPTRLESCKWHTSGPEPSILQSMWLRRVVSPVLRFFVCLP